MKKLSVLLLLATTITITHAQSSRTAKEHRSPLRFGVKAGGNLSRMGISDAPLLSDIKSSFGFGAFAGGLLEISGPAGSKLKGQIEALYSFHNVKNTFTLLGESQEMKTTIHQITVPVMVRYFPIPELSFNAGASVNFNLASDFKVDGVKYGNDDNLQTVQVGVLAGATYYIYKGFFVDARYNYYFGSVMKRDNDTDPAYRLSAIQLGVGYKF